MDFRDWAETRRELCRMVAKRGAVVVAGDLPADKRTVYRLITGETRCPSLALRAAVERLIEEGRQNGSLDECRHGKNEHNQR